MNIDRLNKAVQFAVDEYVRANTEGVRGMWDQGTWGRGEATEEKVTTNEGDVVQVVCNSGCCLAGNIVIGAGDKFVAPGTYAPGTVVSVEECVTKDGEFRSVSDRAEELLDITSSYVSNDDTDGDLFGGDNDIDDVLRLARAMAEEHGQTLTVNLQKFHTMRARR